MSKVPFRRVRNGSSAKSAAILINKVNSVLQPYRILTRRSVPSSNLRLLDSGGLAKITPAGSKRRFRPSEGFIRPAADWRSARLQSLPCVQGEGDSYQAGAADRWGNDFQPATVRFDDLSTDSKAKAKPDITRGKERRGRFFGGLGRKTNAVILHLDLQAPAAVGSRIRLKPHADLRIGRIRLQRVKHHLGKGMLQGGPISCQYHRSAARLIL